MGFAKRVAGAALLDSTVYDDIARDKSATVQAAAVVLATSCVWAVGAFPTDQARLFGAVLMCAAALVAWPVGAVLAYGIGAKLFPETDTPDDLGAILRTLGFARLPLVIWIVALAVPSATFAVKLGAGVWVFATTVIAVRQALRYRETIRAAAVGVLASVAMSVFLHGFYTALAHVLVSISASK